MMLTRYQYGSIAGVLAILSLVWGNNEKIVAYARSDNPPLASVSRVDEQSKLLVKTINDGINSIRADMLERRAYTDRRDQCYALKANQNALATRIGEGIQSANRRYQILTGVSLDIRPCIEF